MEFTTILQLISTTSILSAGIFAGIQLRFMNKQREKDSTIQLLQTFQTPEFAEALEIVFNLPEGLSKKQVEDRLGDKMLSVLIMFGTFESLGILVYKKQLDVDLVDSFFSGSIILTWRKLKNFILETRKESKRETYYEWVQWQCELFEKREELTPRVPAYAEKNHKKR